MSRQETETDGGGFERRGAGAGDNGSGSGAAAGLVTVMYRFPDEAAAGSALGMLRELGYTAYGASGETIGRTAVEIVVEHQDMSSAMEISLAYGGEMLEPGAPAATGWTEAAALQSAYALDAAYVPAHLVADDGEGAVQAGFADGVGDSAEQGVGRFDPSDGDYDHFDAGVHI